MLPGDAPKLPLGVRIGNAISLLIAVLAVGALGIFLAGGTLFFDDPNASYLGFLAVVGSPALAVVVVAASCRWGSSSLAMRGFDAAATAVSFMPLAGVPAAFSLLFLGATP